MAVNQVQGFSRSSAGTLVITAGIRWRYHHSSKSGKNVFGKNTLYYIKRPFFFHWFWPSDKPGFITYLKVKGDGLKDVDTVSTCLVWVSPLCPLVWFGSVLLWVCPLVWVSPGPVSLPVQLNVPLCDKVCLYETLSSAAADPCPCPSSGPSGRYIKVGVNSHFPLSSATEPAGRMSTEREEGRGIGFKPPWFCSVPGSLGSGFNSVWSNAAFRCCQEDEAFHEWIWNVCVVFMCVLLS